MAKTVMAKKSFLEMMTEIKQLSKKQAEKRLEKLVPSGLGDDEHILHRSKMSPEQVREYHGLLYHIYGDKDKRAKDMGFSDKTYYHGTFHDIKSFDPDKANSNSFKGKGIYVTDNPEDASHNYANPEASEALNKISQAHEQLASKSDKSLTTPEQKQLWKRAQESVVGNKQAQVYPVKVATESPDFKGESMNPSKEFEMPHTEATEHLVVPNAEHIRSAHASYDPRYKNSKHILAAEGGNIAPIQSFADGGAPVAPVPAPTQAPTALPEGFEMDAPTQTQQPGALPQGFDLDSEYYGSRPEQTTAFLEGIGEGAAGPIATLGERAMGANPQEMLARREANPWTHGIGEGIGFVGSMLTGVGEAGVLAKVGEAAKAAAGLGKAASFGAKVGSAAVQQAAEMAVMQGGDEVSKMIMQDPNQTVQTAAVNLGLAGLMGGVVGGALGTVPPLWQATIGPKVEEGLSTLKSVINGSKTLTPKEGVQEATRGLGLDAEGMLNPVEKALVSEEGGLLSPALERDRPEATEALDGLREKIANSVTESAGVRPSEALEYDKADGGIRARDSFIKEVREKIEPIQQELQAHEAENAKIAVPDQARLDQFGQLVERGMQKFTPTSEYAKLYSTYGQQLLDHENIAGIQKLESELGNKIRGLQRSPGVDYNTVNALSDIRSAIKEFKYKQIEDSILGIAGREEGGPMAAEKIAAQRESLNKYRQVAEIVDQAQDHFDLGNFQGKETLAKKLEAMSPEQAANKLSFKNNREAIPFLQQYFPSTYESVRQNEAREFLKPAMMKGAKKGTSIDITKLADTIDKAKAGQSTYLNSILPTETLARVEHAKTLLGALPDLRSSKTAKWTEKLMAHLPASALAAVQFIAGHNPIGGLIVGEMASRMQREVPDAIKLAYVKWLASGNSVKSEGFKAMVDMIDNTIKGQNILGKASKAVFKADAMVIGQNLLPTEADRSKLDKLVTSTAKNPDKFVQQQTDSHLGHYMPEHQQALSQTSTQAIQYLQQLKPKPHVLGPLDKTEPPTKTEIGRYSRALDIAASPAIVLQHVKNGTLLPSDIADLNAMYPGLYQNMTQTLTSELMGAQSKGIIVPYKTRIGLSLFLGQPIDTTMSPMSILAAQPQPTPMPAAQGGAKGKTRKGTSTLGKSNKSYMTASQNAEEDRSGRD